MTPLNPVGVAKGGVEGGHTIYQWIGKDIKGNDYMMVFALANNFIDSFEKMLGRLIPIRVETEPTNEKENTEDGSSTLKH